MSDKTYCHVCNSYYSTGTHRPDVCSENRLSVKQQLVMNLMIASIKNGDYRITSSTLVTQALVRAEEILKIK